MDILKFLNSKSKLREEHKNSRKLMNKEDKLIKDFKIFKKFISSDLFLESNTILIYVSNKIEVDTKKIIKYCLSVGKKVAVPISISDNFSLEFYFINSMNDLSVGCFSILEPNINVCKLCDINKLTAANCLCVVPGFAFDFNGYRIGYGKGYYDRFLKNYKYRTIGFCYEMDFIKLFNRSQYDLPVDFILTEKQIFEVAKRKV